MEHKEITIRTEIQPGDIGYITYLHGSLYKQEYGYSISFEAYVAQGFYEFYQQYDPSKDCVWICEHNGSIIGSLLLMHRSNRAAQLRYFILLPPYRGIGLGKRLMKLFMSCLKERGYQSAYLWTTNEQVLAALLYKRFGFQLTEEKNSTAFGKLVQEQKYELTFSAH
jgi:N-acetylglutamate synthase-like GNAT family acetyltransferase